MAGPFIIGAVFCTIGLPISILFLRGYGIIPRAGRLKVYPPKDANLASRIYALVFGPLTFLIGLISLATFVKIFTKN